MRREKRRDLAIEVVLPVHPLGNRLDHQIAAPQLLEVLVIVGRDDEGRQVGLTQRRRIEFAQAFDRPTRDTAAITVFRRQVVEHHVDLRIDQMGGDLRAHDAGAKHRDFSNDESGHRFSVYRGRKGGVDRMAQPASSGCAIAQGSRSQTCVRPSVGTPT